LAVVTGVIQVAGTFFSAHHQTAHRDFDTVAVLLLIAGAAALRWRRRYPVTVLGTVFAATLAYVLLGYPRGPVFFALVFALINALVRERRAAVGVTLVVGYVSLLWGPSALGTGPAPTLGEALGVAAWLLFLVVATEFARSKRQQVIEAARTRREESRRQASEERLRIARDLHDVLAHNISLINVQAGVALHLMDDDPQQARTALSAIKDASNEALGELRSVLDVLRQGHAPRRPTSGLDQIDELIARTEAAGLGVSKIISGQQQPLPSEVDVAAFRIVQESLTNATRHAGDARVDIEIAYRPDELTLTIEDDGNGAASSSLGGGNGIPGMRERVASLGGDFAAGPRPEGGFRVRAVLPIPREEGTR
jgi:signal transduction histidine kinase